MSVTALERLEWLEKKIRQMDPLEKRGRVLRVNGLIVESEGPRASLGDICGIRYDQQGHEVPAEVVGFRANHVLLMPLAEIRSLHPGCPVILRMRQGRVPVGNALVGRVINGLCEPMDDKGQIRTHAFMPLQASAPNPMSRPVINDAFQTGIRSIDTFATLGHGQRVGIFSGSGVGKSTLLGMIARGSSADINVIALIGERGREVREFLENDLGPEGLAKSVVVVATSDQSAPLRLRTAFAATAIAEYFRDQNHNVLFLMDSLTRFALAQREIGLSVGEPPTTRGFTPSVFALLPRLLERTGTAPNGSITALYSVLVEGGDFDEPISDAVRGILDGHVLLNRDLATAGHYPPVDVLGSVSRLVNRVCAREELDIVTKARQLLAVFRKNEDLINVGAYKRGVNKELDLAIEKQQLIMQFFRQNPEDLTNKDDSFTKLKEIMR